MATNTTAAPAAHHTAPVGRPAGAERRRRSTTTVPSQPATAAANTAITRGRLEILVWITKLPTSTAPSSDGHDRARAAAHSRMNSSRG